MTYKLLFVDDEPIFKRTIKQYFKNFVKSSEYEILFADSGETALETIEQNNDIDLLLTDLKMPAAKIQGVELIKTLHKQNIDLKTVVISVYGDSPQYTESIKEDVDLFITKPFEIMDLQDVIGKILGNTDHQFNDTDTKVNNNTNNTIVDLTKEFSSQQKIQLIKQLIKNLSLESLEIIEDDISSNLKEKIKINKEIKEKREILIEQIKKGEISPNTCFDVLDKCEILEKYIPKDGKYFGPYYYLRWWNSEKKKIENRYLGKNLPPALMLKNVKKCKEMLKKIRSLICV
jgi:YesN/AraC family two-component response regulator